MPPNNAAPSMSTQQRLASEQGFILVWGAILLFPMLFIGVVFLSYGRAAVMKLQAQYDAMNFATIGGYSAEFDSNETLSAMAMLGAGLNISTEIEPSSTSQSFGNGKIIFNHDTSHTGRHTVAAYVSYTLDPLTQFVSQLGSVETTGLSRSIPERTFFSVSLDYSRSLLSDGKIDNSLAAFQVTGNGPNGEGANGYWDAAAGKVKPTPAIQNVLPFGIESARRFLSPWSSISSAFPSVLSTAPGCFPNSEIGCQAFDISHETAMRLNVSDLFMAYKRSAILLTGLLFQLTPYVNVNVLAAEWGPRATVIAGWFGAGVPGTNIPAPDNDGNFSLWKWNQNALTNLHVDSTLNLPAVDIERVHTLEDPADPFSEDLPLYPNMILQISMGFTGYRKIARHYTITDSNGDVVSSPGQFSSFYDPPLIVFENKPQWGPPLDSFHYRLGSMTASGAVPNAEFVGIPYGWPTYPLPLFGFGSPAIHPPQAEIPPDLLTPRHYDCTTGPPANNNAPLSTDPLTTGYALCIIAKNCGQAIPSCEPGNTIPAGLVNLYYDSGRPQSPGGCGVGEVARCEPLDVPPGMSSEAAPICLNGFVRCVPKGGLGVAYPTWFSPRCYNSGTSSYTASTPACDPASATPSGALGPAVDRGTVSAPANPSTDYPSNLFYALMDLTSLGGGTRTDVAAANAVTDAQEFLAATNNSGKVAFLLITDGRPFAPSSSGGVLVEDTVLLNNFKSSLDTLTENLGGTVFTWFLGHKNSYSRLLEDLNAKSAAGQLNAAQQTVVDTYVIPAEEIPAGQSCTDFQSIGYNCNWYNTSVLPQHLADAEMLTEFKAALDQPPNRILIESEVSGSNAGLNILDQNGFLNGMTYVIAWLKGRRTFDL